VELNYQCIGSDRLAAFTMAEPAVGLDRLVGWWITDDGCIEQFLRRRHPLNNRLSILWDDKICTEATCNVQERVLRTTCEDIEFFAEWFDEPGCESGAVEKLCWTDGDVWVRPNQRQWSDIRAAEAAVSAAAATAELLKTPWVGCDGIKPAWAYKASVRLCDVRQQRRTASGVAVSAGSAAASSSAGSAAVSAGSAGASSSAGSAAASSTAAVPTAAASSSAGHTAAGVAVDDDDVVARFRRKHGLLPRDLD
jgi:hypothetical protein